MVSPLRISAAVSAAATLQRIDPGLRTVEERLVLAIERAFPLGHRSLVLDKLRLRNEELAARIAEETQVREDAARAEAARLGIQFLGRRALKAMSRYGYPKSRVRWFQIAPVVAAKDAGARVARILENRTWSHDYDIALGRFVAGDRDVVFPYGTYKLPRHYGANVEPSSV